MVIADKKSTASHQGKFYIWSLASALAFLLLLTIALLSVIIFNAIGYFWIPDIQKFDLKNGESYLGYIKKIDTYEGKKRFQVQVGNREIYRHDVRWFFNEEIKNISTPLEIVVVERQEYGIFYGLLSNIPSKTDLSQEWEEINKSFDKGSIIFQQQKEYQEKVKNINYQIRQIENTILKEQHRTKQKKNSKINALLTKKGQLLLDYNVNDTMLDKIYQQFEQLKLTFYTANKIKKEISVAQVVDYYQPNKFSWIKKIQYYIHNIFQFISEEPREANTEGGIFPAIFGTIALVFLMSIFAFPLGIVIAIYFQEYSKPSFLLSIVRISISNLAGIPSIVYGIFGLAFFIYGIGGSLDSLLYPERYPNPTFGTGGLLWASLTLAILTVPIVVVSAEEAISSVPHTMKEASLALGSTKFQTLWRVILPTASPGILTGFILAIARAAGEVAPLMITGVVKLAPQLPIDGNFPFIHLDRKFMHLGFHIFDIAFQSPNIETSKPMVYASTLLLILIVLLLTSVAIYFRERLRERFLFKNF